MFRAPIVRWEMETMESLEACEPAKRAYIVVSNKETVSNKREGESWHLRLSS